MKRNDVLLGTALIAALSLILAMPFAAMANQFLGFEGFSTWRFVWLELSLGALIMVAIGAPLAARARQRLARDQARKTAVPTQATLRSVREEPVKSRRVGVRLTLEVGLPGGGQRRVLSPTWLVGKVDRPRLVPGAVLDVKHDPARPEHVFPNCDWLFEG